MTFLRDFVSFRRFKATALCTKANIRHSIKLISDVYSYVLKRPWYAGLNSMLRPFLLLQKKKHKNTWSKYPFSISEINQSYGLLRLIYLKMLTWIVVCCRLQYELMSSNAKYLRLSLSAGSSQLFYVYFRKWEMGRAKTNADVEGLHICVLLLLLPLLLFFVELLRQYDAHLCLLSCYHFMQ